MKTIYLMRHGQTLFNVMKLNQGQCDSPLTEAGIEQAKNAGKWYQDHGTYKRIIFCVKIKEIFGAGRNSPPAVFRLSGTKDSR